MSKLCYLILCLFLSSCNSYRLLHQENRPAFCVPFSERDEDGLFTQVLIDVLTAHGYEIKDSSRFQLEIKLIKTKIRPLGYTYGFDNQDLETKALYANEGRLEWSSVVSIRDSQTNQTLLSSYPLVVTTDFNYQIDDKPFDEIRMSLGQLNVKSEAIISAQENLKSKLALKIVYWLILHSSDIASIAKK
jgi:hypothetical protein